MERASYTTWPDVLTKVVRKFSRISAEDDKHSRSWRQEAPAGQCDWNTRVKDGQYRAMVTQWVTCILLITEQKEVLAMLIIYVYIYASYNLRTTREVQHDFVFSCQTVLHSSHGRKKIYFQRAKGLFNCLETSCDLVVIFFCHFHFFSLKVDLKTWRKEEASIVAAFEDTEILILRVLSIIFFFTDCLIGLFFSPHGF